MSTTTHVLFGLHTDTGQLVDVSGVKNGLACDCICPSCKLPLEARQGEIRNWHFAHSSRSGNRVETACDFSFAVSVRMMVRQLASEAGGLSLRLPKLEKTYHHTDPRYGSFAVPYTVTRESSFRLDPVQLDASLGSCRVDIFCAKDVCSLAIQLTHSGRKMPEALQNVSFSNVAVLEIDIGQLRQAFENTREGEYKETLRGYLADTTAGKYWRYHPRQQRCLDDGVLGIFPSKVT